MKIRPTPSSRKPWHTDEYVAYLQSEEWTATRRAALERAGHRCEYAVSWERMTREENGAERWEEQIERCPETANLEVHHRTYERLGAESWGDLIVLCREHHRSADRQRALWRAERRRFFR